MSGQIEPDVDQLKEIPGFPNHSVTSDGRVWSKPRRYVRGGWMSMDTQGAGYLYVKPVMNGKQSKLYAHRAVALAWIGDPPEGKNFVCHRDGNPANNEVSNLYWGDQFDNMADMVTHGNSRLGGKW